MSPLWDFTPTTGTSTSVFTFTDTSIAITSNIDEVIRSMRAIGRALQPRSDNMQVITDSSFLNDLPVGGWFRLATGGVRDRYIKAEDGQFFKESEPEVLLPVSAFGSSIRQGYVYGPSNYKIGDIIGGSDGFWYKVLGREGEEYVCAKTDSSGAARRTERVVCDPEGTVDDTVNLDHISPAFELIERIEALSAESARLETIISSGVVPEEVEYLVTVEVAGEVEIRPSATAAKRLVGDPGISVTSVGRPKVKYTKTVAVPKSSRWGCACDLVSEADLAAPGSVGSWMVVACAPREGESTVHASQAEEVAEAEVA